MFFHECIKNRKCLFTCARKPSNPHSPVKLSDGSTVYHIPHLLACVLATTLDCSEVRWETINDLFLKMWVPGHKIKILCDYILDGVEKGSQQHSVIFVEIHCLASTVDRIFTS